VPASFHRSNEEPLLQPDLPTLTWRAIATLRPSFDSPVLLDCAQGRERTLALAHMGADAHAIGARILWVGSQRVARPLAWLPLREQRFDPWAPRPEFSEVQWPGVNPFDLQPGHLTDWICGSIGDNALRREDVSAAVSAAQSHGVGRPSWSPPTYAEGRSLLAAALGRPIESLPEAAERTEVSFQGSDLTVISGHPDDLRARSHAISLLVLAFVGEALRNPNRTHWLVIEDWLDVVPEAVRGMVASALLDLGRLARGAVVICGSHLATWRETRSGRLLLAPGTPLVTGAGATVRAAMWTDTPLPPAPHGAGDVVWARDRASDRWHVMEVGPIAT
jgi:hypothetical protein